MKHTLVIVNYVNGREVRDDLGSVETPFHGDPRTRIYDLLMEKTYIPVGMYVAANLKIYPFYEVRADET